MSSVVVRQVAEALGQALASALALDGAPQVIESPPSHEAEYPTCAIEIDRFRLALTQEDDLEYNASNALMVGSLASIEHSDGSTCELAAGVHLVHVGTLRGKAKIWVGARYAVKREELEELVLHSFNGDGMTPGRLDFALSGLRVGGYRLAWDVTVAALLDDEIEWSGEMVFTERVWSWISVLIDVPILMPRNAPIASTLVIALTSDLDSTITNAQTLAPLVVEQHLVNPDGTVAAYP